jgi:SHS2 domain-containing protein
MKDKNKWEHFTHKADIGIRGFGSTLADAFAMGALALTNIVTDSNKIKANKKVYICCTAPDEEILFADWLNAIIYKMDTLNMLFCEFNIKLEHLNLEATIKGEPIDRNRHQPVVDVKGATYTELKVYKKKGKWVAQCVIDV